MARPQKGVSKGFSIQPILEDFGLLTLVTECPLLAEAVEKLFGALKSRSFGNERKFDSNKINSLGIQQFGNARRFRLKTGFSGVFQQPGLLADSITAPERRPLSSAKPTFESALRFQRVKFHTETLPRVGPDCCDGPDRL